MGKKIRLFVDMDGTLAVFTPVQKMETLYEEGYFRKLQPLHNVVEAIKVVMNKYKEEIDVHILSACLDSEYARKEKNEWLDEHLPMIDKEHRIFCEYGKDKASFIDKPQHTDVLLDDYTKNLNNWQGIGIKILNGINDTNKSWKGERVTAFTEPTLLCYSIKNSILSTIVKQKGVGLRKKVAQASKEGVQAPKKERSIRNVRRDK